MTPLRPEPPAEVPPGPPASLVPPATLAPQYQYVWSAMSGAPILRASSGQTIYYLTDAEGNVTTLTDSSGSPVERYVYDPYGNVSVYENANWTGTPSSTSSYGNAYLYGGMMYDAATGLYYASARWYNPAVGQFTSQDPTGFAAGDANLYRYVGDNPATMTDPWGLSGGGGGEDTWDPGDVSPLMPMAAAGTANEGPMVNEMGLNVPSQLMPMIAPDAPFEGPMVTEIGASVPPQLMPMVAPETPFEGPMVNEIGASVPSPLMPMIAPDTPFEGPMVHEIGAGILYGGETIPLLAPGVVYTSRDGSTWTRMANGQVCHTVSYTCTVAAGVAETIHAN